MLFKKIAREFFNRLPIRLRCLIISIFQEKGNTLIGVGSYIHPSVHILGKANVHIGANTCLSEGCWLNVNHRLENKKSIVIGNDCFIGKHNFFTSGDAILIGDYTLTTIGCKFIGSTHKLDNPEVPYLLAGTTSEDRIQIGANCFFGAGATVLGNIKIGHGSIIGAESLVLQDVPPFSIVMGNPAIVIKRYSFSKKTWLLVSDMSSDDEIGMPNEQEYLEQLKTKFPIVNLPWIAAGKSMGDI
jgi:acetyltransferase-like isoleucine patch superfamily enzyme